ncbi:MAG TPA: hypothetical protein VGG30_06710 [Pirellulales bacterium]|jgi:hypothetical protein
MRKQILTVLCGVSLLALGCKDPVVKNEMEKAEADLKAAGHETAEAGRHMVTAGEAASREAAADVKQEAEQIKESVTGSGPGTTPEGK